jgi:hypothetical protein
MIVYKNNRSFVSIHEAHQDQETSRHFTIWTTREIIQNTKVSLGLPQTGYNTGNGYAYVNEGE